MCAADHAAPPLTIHLLGPFESWVNGAPLPRLRTRKGQWLLALLCLRHDRAVERSWLAGTLWPESDESLSHQSLRMALTDLRHALGGEARRLISPTSGTLRLDTASAEVDIFQFDGAVERGNPDALEEAIRCYRGPLLEGCSEEWVFSERQAREEAYLDALERLAEAALAAAKPEAAAGYLRRAAAVDPLRESAQRALMTALAASGSCAASEVYHELRRRLLRELNAEPSSETRALFERLRSEVRRGAPPARPMVDGSGLMVQGGVAPRPPSTINHQPSTIAGGMSREGNLPQPLSAFIGREKELHEVGAHLVRARLVTLTGTGGIGKTRLAIRAAEEILGGTGACPCPSDGAWFVELAALTDRALVPQAVARALQVRETPGSPLTETLQEALRDRQLNCCSIIAST